MAAYLKPDARFLLKTCSPQFVEHFIQRAVDNAIALRPGLPNTEQIPVGSFVKPTQNDILLHGWEINPNDIETVQNALSQNPHEKTLLNWLQRRFRFQDIFISHSSGPSLPKGYKPYSETWGTTLRGQVREDLSVYEALNRKTKRPFANVGVLGCTDEAKSNLSFPASTLKIVQPGRESYIPSQFILERQFSILGLNHYFRRDWSPEINPHPLDKGGPEQDISRWFRSHGFDLDNDGFLIRTKGRRRH